MEFGWALYSGFSKYFQFHGRTGRAEYAYWWLFFNMGLAATALADALLFSAMPLIGFVLATIAPTLAVTVRRLHDVDRSGWWLLAIWFPVAGLVLVIALASWPGTPGPNRHGAGRAIRQDGTAVLG